VYTVISGVFCIGLGTRFDAKQLQAYPPEAVTVLPGGTPHFHWAKSGAYVTQVSAIGRSVLTTSTRSTTRGTAERGLWHQRDVGIAGVTWRSRKINL
jgi:hypothetical protein